MDSPTIHHIMEKQQLTLHQEHLPLHPLIMCRYHSMDPFQYKDTHLSHSRWYDMLFLDYWKHCFLSSTWINHSSDVIMSTVVSQISGISITASHLKILRRVPHFKMNCKDLMVWQGTRIIASAKVDGCQAPLLDNIVEASGAQWQY